MAKLLYWLVVIGFIGDANAYISGYRGALHPYTLPFALYIKAVPSITKIFELYSLFAKKLKKYFSG